MPSHVLAGILAGASRFEGNGISANVSSRENPGHGPMVHGPSAASPGEQAREIVLPLPEQKKLPRKMPAPREMPEPQGVAPAAVNSNPKGEATMSQCMPQDTGQAAGQAQVNLNLPRPKYAPSTKHSVGKAPAAFVVPPPQTAAPKAQAPNAEASPDEHRRLPQPPKTVPPPPPAVSAYADRQRLPNPQTQAHRDLPNARQVSEISGFEMDPPPWTGEALQVKNEKGIWVTWPNWLGAHEQPQDLPFPYSNGRTPGRFINPNLQCFIIFKNNFKFSVCTDGAGARTMLRMSQEHVLPLSMVRKSSVYCEGPGVGASSSALRFPDTRPGDDHQ